MTRTLLAALLASACLTITAAYAAEPESEPGSTAFIRLNGTWKGFFPHGNEYVEYVVNGDAEPLDLTHIKFKPGQGMILTFADKKNFPPGKSLLEAHRAWELAYWRQQTDNKVESRSRDDLAQGQSGVMVTEMRLPVADAPGGSVTAYMVAAAADNGVFVFAISPVTPEDDATVKKLIATIKVVHKPLDMTAEARKNLSETQNAKRGKKQ